MGINLGRASDPRELDESTLRRAMDVLGADHPMALGCKSNLGQDLVALGEVDRGHEVRQQAISALMERLGGDHPVMTQIGHDSRANCDIDPMPL
jgi:hypothetical protein